MNISVATAMAKAALLEHAEMSSSAPMIFFTLATEKRVSIWNFFAVDMEALTW